MSAFFSKIADTCTDPQHRMKLVILGVCSLSMLGAAGIITWYYAANRTAPDAQMANVQKIADYIKSDQFLEKSSVERGEYIEKLMGRYQTMSPDERRQAQETMGNVLKKDRKLEKTFALSFASKQADEYSKIKDPVEKDRFIDRWLTMMELAHGGRERARQEYQRHTQLGQSQKISPGQRKQSLSRIRRSLPLVMSKTSAKDRAKMAKLARDAAYRMQERYSR